MYSKNVTLNLKVNAYGNRVLGVIKEKFGLKDKSEALNKILDLYGDEFVEKEVKDEVILDIINDVEEMKKKNTKPISFDELDKLSGA
ncbi:MAG: DUF2683 family protein [Candidatus Diapherotrites archaeon]|nr:DUF2683 family protein [Candidatus Diapherotrites archaeon]